MKDNRISNNQDLIQMCLFVFIRGFEVLTLFEKTKPMLIWAKWCKLNNSK